MTSKKKWLIMVAVSTTILLLAAYGSSNESKIIGSWKTVVDDIITSYLEINEERFINRSESVTAEYTMTETQNNNFRLEVIDPESGSIALPTAIVVFHMRTPPRCLLHSMLQ